MKAYWRNDDHGLSIYHGDCLKVMPSLCQSFDLSLTDPPFNLGYQYDGTFVDAMSEDDYAAWCAEWFALLPERSIITCGRRNHQMWLRQQNPTAEAIWLKSNSMVPGKLTNFMTWQPILFFGDIKKSRVSDTFDYPIGRQQTVGTHTCPKPLSLFLDILEHYTVPTDTIIDPFVGSGTTLVAAYMLGLPAVGIEISEVYCEEAALRLEAEINQGRIFVQKEVTKAKQLAIGE